MIAIFLKEINAFFSSTMGYLSLVVFFLLLGLFLWVFPDYSLLDYGYASLDQFFSLAPWIFTFLIPAITMRAFAEEAQTGTLETLTTKPLTTWQIVLGKYAATLALVLFALLPTFIYVFSIYALGSPVGNIDIGATLGSYLGLFLLASVFAAIGIFASALTKNQIVAFLLATFLAFFCHSGFYYLSTLPIFYGKADTLVQYLGLEIHYQSISRGLVDSRDVVYFLSLIFIFLYLTVLNISRYSK